MRRRTVKRLVEVAATRGLKLLGLNGLVAGVVSHLFWRFVVVPIVKHAHRKGGLVVKKDSIHLQKHDKTWHNLKYG